MMGGMYEYFNLMMGAFKVLSACLAGKTLLWMQKLC
ncbi:hypothetical protein EPYR_01478 [Erwinia pyrifoliae DSM 12163]|nr:hypothetical protein EPYR_01478 [Erwinia pyrifoliae DSM 12163]